MLRKLAAGVALAVAVAVPLAGCATAAWNAAPPAQAGGSTAMAAAPAAPAVLAGAVQKTQAAGSFTFVIARGNDRYEGLYDAGARAIFLGETGHGTIRIWYFGADLYLLGFPGTPPGRAVHVAVADLTDGGPFAAFADPLAGLRLLTTATTVEQPRAGTLAGSIDLAKLDTSTPAGTKLFAAALARHVKGGVTVLPFTATVDDQGRITSVKVTFPGADRGKDLDYRLTLADFGTRKTVTKPTSTVEASRTVHKLLNGAG